MIARRSLIALAACALAPRSAEAKEKAPRQAGRLPRVLIIGDSISIGYTAPLRALLQGVAVVERIPENGGPTSRGMEQIEKWLGDGRWDLIHFNWGLHDLKRDSGDHQVPPATYRSHLTALVRRMKQTGARLIWASTTPAPEGVTPPRAPSDVLLYNSIARQVMRAEGVAINDLYSAVLPRLGELQQPVNVHFTRAGSAFLAARVAEAIRAALPEPPPAQ